MKETFGKFSRATLKGMLSAISSRGSADGLRGFALRGGRTAVQSGRGAVPARGSVPPARVEGSPTLVTSGRGGSNSSASAVLQSSLESKLRLRFATVGGTLFNETWREKATPAGWRYSEHTASGRRISGSGAGSSRIGWPSPCVVEPSTSPEKVWERKQRLTQKTGVYRGNDCGLGSKVQLANWPSPRHNDSGKRGMVADDPRNGLVTAANMTAWPSPTGTNADKSVRTLEGSEKEAERKGWGNDLCVAAMSSWPTPNALPPNRGGLQSNPEKAMERRAQGHQLNLDDAATLASWPTPVAEPANGTPEAFLERKRKSVAKTGRSMGICLSDIAMVAQLASWPMPQTFDASNDGTPRALRYKGDAPSEAGNTRDPNTPGSYRGDLKDYAGLAFWMTPKACDGEFSTPRISGRPMHRSTHLQTQAIANLTDSDPTLRRTTGVTPSSSPAATPNSGQLNPRFSLWLMGYPTEWASCGEQAMPSSRKSRRRS